VKKGSIPAFVFMLSPERLVEIRRKCHDGGRHRQARVARSEARGDAKAATG
jgi:hypothetical protein